MLLTSAAPNTISLCIRMLWKEIRRRVNFISHVVLRLPASSSEPEVVPEGLAVPSILPLPSFPTHSTITTQSIMTSLSSG